MVTWQNRIFGLCIPILMMVACGQSALQQPDLIAGQFQVGSDTTVLTTKLDVYSYYSQAGTVLSGLPVAIVDASGAGPWTVFLGFSEFLNGNLIQIPIAGTNGQVSNFSPAPNSAKIVEVWTCLVSTGCTQSTNYTQLSTGFTLSYLPDGGYVPRPDTPVSNFPPPAVAVMFTAALPAASVIAIHVIANTLSDTDNIFMAQETNSNGDKITNPSGQSPVAGTVWFQTK